MEEYPEKTIKGVTYARVCRSDEIFERKGKRFIFDGDNDLQVAVFRLDGELFALYNICPHRHQDRIFEGVISGENVTCPLHGWTYSVKTGENINKEQGIKSLKKFGIFEEGGWVWVQKPDRSNIPKWRRFDYDETFE